MGELSSVPAFRGWASIASSLLARGVALGLDRHFRAGQSMQHLVFSTAPHHGLQDELRVTVAWPGADESAAVDGSRIEVSLARANRWFSAPEHRDVVPGDAAWPAVAAYLTLLWRATKGGAPPPAGLPDTPIRGRSQ